MSRKSIAGKMVFAALCVFFCLSQVSCTIGKGGFPFSGLLQSEKSKVNAFVSKIRTARGNPDSHYLLACYYQERGRHKEAVKEFSKVVAIDPLHVRAHNGLGVSYSELKYFSKAIDAYKTALTINPKLGYVHNNLGYTYLIQGNADAAVAEFKKASALNIGSSRVHNNLGMAYLVKGDAKKAGEELEIGGGKAWAVYNMAQWYYQNDMFYEAREHFAKALEMNPALVEAQKGLEASDTLYRISQAISGKEQARCGPITADKAVDIPGPLPRKLETAEVKKPVPSRIEAAKRVDSLKWLQNVEIEIANGNGVRHMAKNMASYLKKRGVKVVRLSNADRFNYQKARITYSKEYSAAAKALAAKIPQIKDVRMADSRQNSNAKIKIILGKDLIPYSKLFKDSRS